jgi:transcriptional regulator with XRE-family HTH domain
MAATIRENNEERTNRKIFGAQVADVIAGSRDGRGSAICALEVRVLLHAPSPAHSLRGNCEDRSDAGPSSMANALARRSEPLERPAQPSRFGAELRRWRIRRGLSQLSLATTAGTTARHVSFLETGRSRPGAELVLRLADALDVPLRARNGLLEAAGLPIAYPHHALAAAILAPYRHAIEYTLGALDPYPAVVVDRALAIVDANRAARRWFALADDGVRPTLVDLLFGPGGLREQVVNYADVAWAWHDRLVRESSGDAVAEDLVRRVASSLRDTPRAAGARDDLVICPTLRVGDQIVRTVGMTVRFAPGREVTLQELSIEVLYPRDAIAEAVFRAAT